MPAGTSILEAAKHGGRAHPALLLPPGASGRRRVPHVPGRGREGAEARARLRDLGRRRAGRARARREGARGAQGRARVAAHQPPARLPDLRPGRRVRAAGLHVPGRARRGPRYREPKRFNPVEDFGGDVAVRRQPLHPVHALRALHGRRRARPGAERQRARRPRGDRQVRGQGPHAPVGGQRRRPLPGRRAAVQGLPEQGARLGARPHRVGLPELHAGLQHDRRDARQRRRAPAAAAERRT